MFKKNDGKNYADILQNRFTAYLKTSVRNTRLTYLKSKNRQRRFELIGTVSDDLFCDTHDYFMQVIELCDLWSALNAISSRERYVVLGHILDEKRFEELAFELNIPYKTVASIFYRALKKLRDKMNGGVL